MLLGPRLSGLSGTTRGVGTRHDQIPALDAVRSLKSSRTLSTAGAGIRTGRVDVNAVRTYGASGSIALNARGQ